LSTTRHRPMHGRLPPRAPLTLPMPAMIARASVSRADATSAGAHKIRSLQGSLVPRSRLCGRWRPRPTRWAVPRQSVHPLPSDARTHLCPAYVSLADYAAERIIRFRTDNGFPLSNAAAAPQVSLVSAGLTWFFLVCVGVGGPVGSRWLRRRFLRRLFSAKTMCRHPPSSWSSWARCVAVRGAPSQKRAARPAGGRIRVGSVPGGERAGS